MTWLTSPLGLLIAGAVGIVVIIVLLVMKSQKAQARDRATAMKKAVAAAAKNLTLSLPLHPNPTSFVDANGVRGAALVKGSIHAYFETDLDGDARMVGGQLLPKLPNRQTGYMPLRPLTPSSWHGDMAHPGAEGPLDINDGLTIPDKSDRPIEFDTCDICNKTLKPAVDAEVSRRLKRLAAMAEATVAPTA